MRRRLAWIAFLGLALGYPVQQVGTYLVNKGATVQQAKTAVSDARAAKRGRYSEEVLVAVPLGQVTAANADIAKVYCDPPPDDGGSEATYDECLAAQAGWFAERYCRVDNGNEVARGARWRVTPEDWLRLRDNRDPGISYTVVRNPGTTESVLAARATPLERCTGEP